MTVVVVVVVLSGFVGPARWRGAEGGAGEGVRVVGCSSILGAEVRSRT